MERRAFLGMAAAGLVVGPTALAAGQVICRPGYDEPDRHEPLPLIYQSKTDPDSWWFRTPAP